MRIKKESVKRPALSIGIGKTRPDMVCLAQAYAETREQFVRSMREVGRLFGETLSPLMTEIARLAQTARRWEFFLLLPRWIPHAWRWRLALTWPEWFLPSLSWERFCRDAKEDEVQEASVKLGLSEEKEGHVQET